MKSRASQFIGDWRIMEMEEWDREYLDEEVPAYIRFEKKGMGEFQFGLVKAGIDYRAVTREGRPAVEFSWEGSAEMDEVSGRGWALLNEDGILSGRLFFHLGDESGFIAARKRGRRKGK